MQVKLENVYEEYNRYIYYLCLKLTKNQIDAEDLNPIGRIHWVHLWVTVHTI